MYLFFVGLGGIIGTFLRSSISHLIPYNGGFPIATFCINIIGSVLLAIYLASSYSKNEKLKLFLATGILSSFTTFSSFSYETMTLIQNDQLYTALLYVGGSVLTSMFVCIIIYFKMKGMKPI